MVVLLLGCATPMPAGRRGRAKVPQGSSAEDGARRQVNERRGHGESKGSDRSKRVAVRELRVAVGNVGFDEIVKILREVWKVPGIGGCDPCRSGLDKFVIEDIAQRFG